MFRVTYEFIEGFVIFFYQHKPIVGLALFVVNSLLLRTN